MKNRLEYFLLNFLSFVISRFSFYFARKIAKVLSLIFFYFIPIRKKIVKKNLKIAFPYLKDDELNRLIKKIYLNLFLVLVEILYLPYFKRDEIEELVKINSELITDELSKNKGLIFVSAHFGNWELMAIASALKLNKTYSIVIKPLRNPYVDDYINQWRTKFGNRIVPLGISIKNIFRELKEKNIVALLADQRASINSMEMEFFGKKTHVYEGPAVLSIKTGAPLIFAIAIRQPDYSYLIELVKIPVPDIEDDNQKAYEITKNYIQLLEDYIRRYPDQWFWFHNRWKH